MRGKNKHYANKRPQTVAEATGVCLSYLKGTADHEREAAEDRVKSFRQIRDLGVDKFRTKAARQVRDKYLDGKVICFLNQAFRYRGKANYRDALYLGYGTKHENFLVALLDDLFAALYAFLHASSHYCGMRIERDVWTTFVSDIRDNCHLQLKTNVLEV